MVLLAMGDNDFWHHDDHDDGFEIDDEGGWRDTENLGIIIIILPHLDTSTEPKELSK